MIKTLNVRREELIVALEIVAKATSTNSIMPMLSSVLVEVNGENCNLTCTDLATTISISIPVASNDNFSAVIPIKILQKLLKLVAEEDIRLLYDDIKQNVKLESEKSKNTISCLPVAEFPSRDEIEYSTQFWLKPTELSTVGELVTFAASTEPYQQTLQGVLMEHNSEEEGLIFIAADGVRSSVYQVDKAERFGDTKFRAIIPTEPLMDFAKLLTGDKINIKVSKSHVEFSSGKTIATLSLLNGNFPKVREAIMNMIKRENNQIIPMNTAEFLQACKMSNVFASESNNRLRIEFGLMFSNVSGYADQTGDSTNMFAMNASKEMAFNVNAKMFIEALGKFGAEAFVVNVASDTEAIIFSAEDFQFYHIIMPTT